MVGSGLGVWRDLDGHCNQRFLITIGATMAIAAELGLVRLSALRDVFNCVNVLMAANEGQRYLKERPAGRSIWPTCWWSSQSRLLWQSLTRCVSVRS